MNLAVTDNMLLVSACKIEIDMFTIVCIRDLY
jgi:hypothetical protein